MPESTKLSFNFISKHNFYNSKSNSKLHPVQVQDQVDDLPLEHVLGGDHQEEHGAALVVVYRSFAAAQYPRPTCFYLYCFLYISIENITHSLPSLGHHLFSSAMDV